MKIDLHVVVGALISATWFLGQWFLSSVGLAPGTSASSMAMTAPSWTLLTGFVGLALGCFGAFVVYRTDHGRQATSREAFAVSARQLRQSVRNAVAATSPDLMNSDAPASTLIATRLPEEAEPLAEALVDVAHTLEVHRESVERERVRVRQTLASIAEGLIITSEDGRVAAVNPEAARLLDLPGDGSSLVGQSLVTAVRDYEVTETLVKAIETRGPVTRHVRLSPFSTMGELSMPRRGTGVRIVKVSAVPFASQSRMPSDLGVGASRRPVGVGAGVIFLEDETELRRSESIRRDFVANVSHELRTPLASLKALVETLEEGALEDPPAAREFLRLMHVEVDSLTQLVFELLELSQIESGQAEMEKRPVVPISLLEAAYRRLRTQATRAGVDLRMAAEHGLPMISADPMRVGQVLLNLLQNAIKFTPEGGVVTLTAARDGNGIRFGVTDTGIGISREDLSRLFERFFKVDRSRASGGTGLGLAIAKHLVQAHGGVIGAFSLGEGHGSTVWFVLPTNGESVAPVSQQASLASQTRGALPSSDAPDGIPSNAVPGGPATPDTP